MSASTPTRSARRELLAAPHRGHALSRSAVIDAAARVVARNGSTGVGWSVIAREAGSPDAFLASRWFPDLPALVDECYSRTAQGLEVSLLRGETTSGTALEKLAGFLVGALETRRQRGSFLSFRQGAYLPLAQQKRLRERDMGIRTRLKRLLMKGRDDGSLALRNLDSSCELILASLQVPVLHADAPAQRMLDCELIELLLAALAEPNPPVTETHRDAAVAVGACLCGAIRYEVDGPFEVMSHCHCSMCRKHHGSAFATMVTTPASGFRWLAGEDLVTTFQSSPSGTRSFCSRCGSVAPTPVPELGWVFCPAGNLEGDIDIGPGSHVFVGSKASWHAISDGLPQLTEI